jgi:hypothetical protein
MAADDLVSGVTTRKHAPKGPLKLKNPMNGLDPMAKPQCRATNRQGQRCKRPPILGGTVCRMHGGAAPQVKNKAEERLRALEMPAIERLAQLIGQSDFPSVAYQASKDVLDRLRGRATEFVEAKVVNVGNLSDEELKAKALELATRE